MIDYQLIADFFMWYGSRIEDAQTGQADYGVISPVNKLEAGLESIRYESVGYQMKTEYLLLTLNQSGIVQKGKSLYINGRAFHVLNTDYYYYANKPLYLRAYLSKMESFEEETV